MDSVLGNSLTVLILINVAEYIRQLHRQRDFLRTFRHLLSHYINEKHEKNRNAPLVLDVLVDEAGDAHGHDGIVPGGDEHQRHEHDHPQEGQRPADQWDVTVCTSYRCLCNGETFWRHCGGRVKL